MTDHPYAIPSDPSQPTYVPPTDPAEVARREALIFHTPRVPPPFLTPEQHREAHDRAVGHVKRQQAEHAARVVPTATALLAHEDGSILGTVEFPASYLDRLHEQGGVTFMTRGGSMADEHTATMFVSPDHGGDDDDVVTLDGLTPEEFGALPGCRFVADDP